MSITRTFMTSTSMTNTSTGITPTRAPRKVSGNGKLASASLEITPLYVASPANDYLSVTMYSDGEGEAKNRPLNFRAGGIVVACGIKNKLIHGDAFLARTFDKEAFPWWGLQ